jgi:thiosulfate reductase cytochrome b subunit
MASPPATDDRGQQVKLHPLFVRTNHWINAFAILIMVGSGWHIYNNHPVFEWITFPRWLTLGGDPETTYRLHKDVGFGNATQWHFSAMWLFFVNGTIALIYGLATGRLQRRWLPIHPRAVVHDFLEAFAFLRLGILPGLFAVLILGALLGYKVAFIGLALALLFAAFIIDPIGVRPAEIVKTVRTSYSTFLTAHDVRMYNAVQKISYVGVLAAALLIFASGLAIWKPVQFSWLTWLFYDFQGARLVHFLSMCAIVLFVLVHVTLALLVPKTIVGMTKGTVRIRDVSEAPSMRAAEV